MDGVIAWWVSPEHRDLVLEIIRVVPPRDCVGTIVINSRAMNKRETRTMVVFAT